MLRWLLRGMRREPGLVEPAHVPDVLRRELRDHVQPCVQPTLLPELQVKDSGSSTGKKLVASTARFAIPSSIIKAVLGRVAGIRIFVRNKRGRVPMY
jgi:hypothetical protein